MYKNFLLRIYNQNQFVQQLFNFFKNSITQQNSIFTY